MNKDELQDWLDVLEYKLASDRDNAESGFSYNHALKMFTHFKEFRAQLEQTNTAQTK